MTLPDGIKYWMISDVMTEWHNTSTWLRDGHGLTVRRTGAGAIARLPAQLVSWASRQFVFLLKNVCYQANYLVFRQPHSTIADDIKSSVDSCSVQSARSHLIEWCQCKLHLSAILSNPWRYLQAAAVLKVNRQQWLLTDNKSDILSPRVALIQG